MKTLVAELGVTGGGCQEEEGSRSSLGRREDLMADRGLQLGGTITEGRRAMLFFHHWNRRSEKSLVILGCTGGVRNSTTFIIRSGRKQSPCDFAEISCGGAAFQGNPVLEGREEIENAFTWSGGSEGKVGSLRGEFYSEKRGHCTEQGGSDVSGEASP